MIFNVFGHRNCGDAALLEAFFDLLKQVDQSVPIGGIAFDPAMQELRMPEMTWAERIGNSSHMTEMNRFQQVMIVAAAFLISLNRAFLPLARSFPKRQRDAIRSLAAARVAFSCPGGYLEDSNKGYLLNCISILLASKLAKLVILAPQSIGPVKGRLGRWLLRRAINSVHHIFVRESESLSFLQELMGPKIDTLSRCSVSGDLAFWFSRHSSGDLDRERRLLGITTETKTLGLSIVDWKFSGCENPSQSRNAYLTAIAELIEHVKRRGSHRIVLFNQVYTDLKLAQEIGDRFPDIVVDTGERDSSTYLELIGECDVFVGTRFHSCIFALLKGVPTTAIAYLPKTTGIMCDLGMSDFVVDINAISGPKLISQFEIMCAERCKISELIAERVAKYRTAHNSFVNGLAKMASQHWNSRI